MVLAPLAMAAGVALAVRARAPAEAPIPEYTVAVEGRVETQRAAHDTVATTLDAREGSVQRVTVRPREATPAPIAAKVLLAGATIAIAGGVRPEVSDLGVVRFDVPGEALRGASEVRVVIAPPAGLARAVAAATSGELAAAGGAVVRIPVDAPVEGRSELQR